MAESINPMWDYCFPNLDRDRRLPPVGPGPKLAERDGRDRALPIVSMSSGRLFLDRVGRHQSPSPLYRHEQNTMHFAEPRAKGDISTLPGRGHFYFALTWTRLYLERRWLGLVLYAASCLHGARGDASESRLAGRDAASRTSRKGRGIQTHVRYVCC